MKLPIIMFFIVLATVIISGCITDQNPVNKLCSMEGVRGEVTAEQCVSDLSNMYDALNDRDSSKCSEISSAIHRESCLQSVGKYSFLEWARLAYGLSDSDINRIFYMLTAPACSEDCSLASINIKSVYIFTDPTYYVNQSRIEHQVYVHNNGACDIRLSSLKFFKGNEAVCTENIDHVLLKGAYKVHWNFDCNITCREFTKAVVTTECGQVVGEIGKDMMTCGTGVVLGSSEFCTRLGMTGSEEEECMNNLNLMSQAIYAGKTNLCDEITYELWRTNCPDWVSQFEDPMEWLNMFFGFTDNQTFSE